MKISLEWLSDFLQNVPTADQAAEALTHGGLPVELIEQVGDDTVIDVEVTSNRSDCLSHRGVARELAALLDLQQKQFTEPTVVASPEQQPRVAIEATALCPHYTAQLIRGVKIGPSPAWLVRRLTALGLRAVNNVVDITNYVMFELGQPLHAFDFDHLGSGEIRVREAKAGETIVSLDGHERKLTAGMLVIADASRPVALAGVMGGRDSEVTEGTTNILLESARFDPLSIRKTARALSMKSDSSYRLERGVDPQVTVLASRRATQLIVELAGGKAVGQIASAGAAGPATKSLTLRAEKLRRVLGIDLEPAAVSNALTRLGFSPKQSGDSWTVTVPSVRLDINVEIDLVEEVARVVGYQNIPVRDEIAIRVTPADRRLTSIEKIRHTLAACGYSESITVTFVSDVLAKSFTPAGSTLMRTSPAVRKADAQLRPSLLPGLLEAVRRNESVGVSGAKLFEIGSAFWIDSNGVETERRRVTLVGGNAREVRGAIEAVAAGLDPARAVQVEPATVAGFEIAGAVSWGPTPLGTTGLIAKSVIGTLGLRETPAAAEIDLQTLLDGARTEVRLQPLPRFPSVKRDLSLVVSDAVAYADVESIVTSCKLPNLETLDYVTTYRGKPLEKGTKSITVQMSFRSATETLTAQAVDGEVKQVVDAAAGRLKAVVRA